MTTNNTVFKAAIAVIILLALLFAVIKLSKHPVSTTHPLGDKESQSGTVKIEQVSQSDLPNKFPSNLPTEAGAEISQNFNATETDGRYNATREFESKKTLAQNIALYTKYLNDNGWEIKANIDKPTLKMVMGKKDNQQLQISCAQNPDTKVSVITITLTEFK